MHANLLAEERSPYLLQHSANPVHWRPWGQPALQAARACNRPILLSIGYAACHWCHVMAHESFEDERTAALMNARFINIKVDREERPDIDHLYMTALHAMGEQGGWPLTMFLSPLAEPFWGGTYFPPEPRWGRPSFRQVLMAAADAWDAGETQVLRNRDALRRAVAAQSAPRPGDLPTPHTLTQVSAALMRLQDTERGGLRGAPKFPNAPILRFLWQHSCRTRDPAPAEAVRRTLFAIARGGITDQIGGGIARYATDADWLVPHFEKMLYDNAQLLELLALSHAAEPDPLLQDTAHGIVAWLERDMRTEGAFAASEDADSEGEEGRFYVWTRGEIVSVLGQAAGAFRAAYDVSEDGNWEGRTILRRVTARGTASEEAELAAGRETLRVHRASRIRPGRDDKILADWNALMVAALCRAAAIFGQPAWLSLAEHAFDRLIALLRMPDGRIAHAWREGRITAAGLLDDQAAMARAALALFEATGNPARLDQAIGLTEAAFDGFGDGQGGAFLSAADATDIPGPRPRTAADGASPSGAGMLAEVLARLFHLTGEPAWRSRAEALLRAFAGRGDQFAAMPTLLAAAAALEDMVTVVVTEGEGRETLLADALASPDPLTTVLRAGPDGVPPLHPAFGKTPRGGTAIAYLCRSGVCSASTLGTPHGPTRSDQGRQTAHAPSS